ncbi:MAG: ATPase V [Bacteroidaceae bacterium]|nr:ATPase V [Bacteroidaceae bacterium]
MITKMNKLTLLVYHKEYIDFLQRLRQVGVVHIVERKSGAVENPEVEKQMALIARYKRTIKRLERCAVENLQPAKGVDGAMAVIEKCDTLLAEIEQRKGILQTLDKDAAALAPWGEFDVTTIEKLESAGYDIRFFISPAKNFCQEWVDEYNAIVVAEQASRLYFVTVTPKHVVVDIDAEVAKLPDASLSALESEKERVEQQIEAFNAELDKLAVAELNTLRAANDALMHDLEFMKVSLDGEKVSGDKLVLLEGWAPEENLAELKAMLDESGAFYDVRPVRRGDEAPVKLKNNAFTRMYEMLTKMYGMPSGTDFDPTPILAPFFSLFFAFCMGDAGYGLILILMGFILKKKLKSDLAGMMNLVITLGIFTTLIGAVLGTFFGMSLLSDFDLPEKIRQFIIAGDIELFGSTYDKQMILALGIGVVHISIAMTVKAINNTVFYGFKESLSAWGWWLVVVGSAVLGTLTFLSAIPAEVSKWAFIGIGSVGALGIYIFNNLRRNVFANIGAGIWDTYNMASGLLGDVLSYIRLFALGLAGGMLGQTFNSLALMLVDGKEGLGAVIGWVGFGLIIIFGHTLNIAMSCLSAFVHPLRLTFVEYFKNAGYEGKGVEYKPFKDK